MFGTIRISLISSAMVYLGLCGSGIAFDIVSDSVSNKNEQSVWRNRIPLLTKQEIIEGFDAGVIAGATHMLMVWDTWNFDDSWNFIVYSYPGEDVNDLIKYYTAPGYYSVSAVYAMHLDMNQQFSDRRWNLEYP